MSNKIIEVQNIKVNITNINNNVYVFLILQRLKKVNLHRMIL